MADVYAISDGNWSDPTIWNSGVVPGTADNVWINGKNLTMDVDINVASLSSEANPGLGTVAGGKITISSGTTRNITCSGDIRHDGNTALFETALSGLTLNVTAANIYSSLNSSSPGTFNFLNDASNTINITGNVVTRNSVTFMIVAGYGVLTVNINGNVSATGTRYAVESRRVDFTITGTVFAGLISTNGPTNTTINGHIQQSGASNAIKFHGSGYGTVTINGNIYGGTAAGIDTSAGYNNTISIIVNGDVYGGTSTPGIVAWQLKSNHSIRVNGDVYAGTGEGANGIYVGEYYGTFIVNGNMKTQIGSPAKTTPVASKTLLISSSETRYIEHWEADLATNQPTGNKLIFETNINANQANPADVRQGVVYGPASEYTGTCAVPPPQAVAYGVPVDNTVGQAAITAQDIENAVWNALIENGIPAKKALRAIAAALAGVLSGAGTGSIQIKGIGNDVVRITANVDNKGNRQSITLSLD